MEPAPPATPRDRRLEAALGRLLSLGTQLAAGVIVLGVAMSVAGGTGRARFGEFVPGGLSGFTSPAAVLRGVAALRPTAVVQLGIILLVLTPVGRVASALILFAARRDATYTLLALCVLATLVLGLLGVVR